MRSRNKNLHNQNYEGSGFSRGFHEGFHERVRTHRGAALRRDMQESADYGKEFRDRYINRPYPDYSESDLHFDSPNRSNWDDGMGRSESNWQPTDWRPTDWPPDEVASRTPMDLSGRYTEKYVSRSDLREPEVVRYGSDAYQSSQSWHYPQTSNFPNHYGKGPKGYRRSDERIREDVCEALAHHPGIDPTNVDVSVKQGVVHLTGSIESRQMKRMTEECAETVHGVVDVRNELRIDTMSVSQQEPKQEISKPSDRH